MYTSLFLNVRRKVQTLGSLKQNKARRITVFDIKPNYIVQYWGECGIVEGLTETSRKNREPRNTLTQICPTEFSQRCKAIH